jgi:hypothetical protein
VFSGSLPTKPEVGDGQVAEKRVRGRNADADGQRPGRCCDDPCGNASGVRRHLSGLAVLKIATPPPVTPAGCFLPARGPLNLQQRALRASPAHEESSSPPPTSAQFSAGSPPQPWPAPRRRAGAPLIGFRGRTAAPETAAVLILGPRAASEHSEHLRADRGARAPNLESKRNHPRGLR